MKPGFSPIVLAVWTALVLPASAQTNLQPFQPAGWALPLVPRPAADGAWNYVPGPATLPGNSASTYWNESCWNAGSSPTSGTFQNHLVIDGVLEATYLWSILPPGSYSTHTNGGPVTVRGGRHTFELRVDGTSAISESNENDNVFARQWVWTPFVLAAGAQATRSAPPDPQGGWSAIPPGQEIYGNCDGLRYTAGSGWDVITARVLNTAADYDVELHSPSTGASQGFAVPLESSARRGGGSLDGVVTNGHFLGGLSYDVGVLRESGSGNYVAEHIVSQTLAFGDSLTLTLGQDQALRIWEVPFGVADVGQVTVKLHMLTGSGSVMLQWLDREFHRGGLGDFTAGTATDGAGRAHLDVNAASGGYYAVVVMRDPLWGLGPRSFTLEVEPALPDITPDEPDDWHSPLVPHQSPGGGGSRPDTLVGYPDFTDWTEVSSGVANIGFGPFSGYYSRDAWLVDGQLFSTSGGMDLNPSSRSWFVVHFPSFPVRGGRHTLCVRYDCYSTVEEISETNNSYAEQYCWSPPTLPYGQSLACPPPPDPWGGLEDFDGGHAGLEEFLANCDGLRLPSGGDSGGDWRAVAVMPLAASAVRVALYRALEGVKHGFDWPRCSTTGNPGRSDWILLTSSFDAGSPTDVGVSRATGAGDYMIQAAAAPTTRAIQSPVSIPGSLEAGEIVDLIAFTAPAGPLALRLDNEAGNIDFGLAVYPGDGAGVRFRSDGVVADARGAGDDEWLTWNVGNPYAHHCIVVYKSRSADIAKSGSYLLRLAPGVTNVPGGESTPERTALRAVAPNPFNPCTTITFDLVAPADTRLEVLDLQGRRVRALVSASLPAGRHEFVWDGRDQAGEPLPSGAYMARLVAGDVRQMRKLTLVK